MPGGGVWIYEFRQETVADPALYLRKNHPGQFQQ